MTTSLKLDRSMTDLWNSPEPFDPRSARIDLLLLASGDDTAELERGEVDASLRFLATRWKWTKRRVERFLARLQRDGFLSGHRRGRHGHVYRIANYDIYQGGVDESGTPNGTGSEQLAEQVADSNIAAAPMASGPSVAPARNRFMARLTGQSDSHSVISELAGASVTERGARL